MLKHSQELIYFGDYCLIHRFPSHRAQNWTSHPSSADTGTLGEGRFLKINFAFKTLCQTTCFNPTRPEWKGRGQGHCWSFISKLSPLLYHPLPQHHVFNQPLLRTQVWVHRNKFFWLLKERIWRGGGVVIRLHYWVNDTTCFPAWIIQVEWQKRSLKTMHSQNTGRPRPLEPDFRFRLL